MLERLLRRQEELRFTGATLRRFANASSCGRQWLDVVADLQREVAMEFGFMSATGIAAAVRRMQTAHVARPELAPLSVYARGNLAEEGSLQLGQVVPDVSLMTLSGQSSSLRDWCGDLTVICAGSWT